MKNTTFEHEKFQRETRNSNIRETKPQLASRKLLVQVVKCVRYIDFLHFTYVREMK